MMAPLMTISDFTDEVREDLSSPGTSRFNKRLPACRAAINSLEESLDLDREGLAKMKKAIKAIGNSGNVHVDTELYLSKALDRLGAAAMGSDSEEQDIGAAYIKFSIVTKELSNLMKMLVQNLNNMVMFPLDSLLKGDLKGVKGDLKKPVEKAWREYEVKLAKVEKEKKGTGTLKASMDAAGLNLLYGDGTLSGTAAAAAANSISNSTGTMTSSGGGGCGLEGAEKERRLLQLQITEYLLKVNEIRTKKGVDLLQHMVEYYNAQTNYFRDGLKTIEHFNGYIQELSTKLATVRSDQEAERRALSDVRTMLKSSTSLSSGTTTITTTTTTNNNINGTTQPQDQKKGDLNLSSATEGGAHSRIQNNHNNQAAAGDQTGTAGGYSLHQLQGNKHFGTSKTGYLLKKSEGKMRVKAWQKRRTEVAPDGYLCIYHNDESKPPTKLNLLTCQVKLLLADEKKSFDLVSYNRTYHFQTEHESDLEAWISVLINCKESALKREFDQNSLAAASETSAAEHAAGKVGLHLSTGSGGGGHSGLGPSGHAAAYGGGGGTSQSLHELQQSIINHVRKLPGNDRCVDCGSDRDATWLAVNFGIVICIECSGIHRDMGVHVSRVQSLTLDRIPTSQLLLARTMTNASFNDIVEATLDTVHLKPPPTATMERRREFIRAKYVDHKFALKTSANPLDLRQDLENAILAANLYHLLQAYVEGADLTWILPSFEVSGDTALHLALEREDGSSLPVVDFLVQNSSSLNKANHAGATPLHVAVERKQIDCLKLLLRSGAGSGAAATARNSLGESPLDLARKFSYHDCVELLECSLAGKKSLFENVNFNWNLTLEDSFLDFSDDELVETDKYMNATNAAAAAASASYSSAVSSASSSLALLMNGRYNALRKRALKSISVDRRRRSHDRPGGGGGGGGGGHRPPLTHALSAQESGHSFSVAHDLSSLATAANNDYNNYNNFDNNIRQRPTTTMMSDRHLSGRSRPSSVVGSNPDNDSPPARDSFRFKQSRKIATEIMALNAQGLRKNRNNGSMLDNGDGSVSSSSFSASAAAATPRRLTGDFERAQIGGGGGGGRSHGRTPSDPQTKTVSQAYHNHLRNRSVDLDRDSGPAPGPPPAPAALIRSQTSTRPIGSTPLSSFRASSSNKSNTLTSTTPPSAAATATVSISGGGGGGMSTFVSHHSNNHNNTNQNNISNNSSNSVSSTTPVAVVTRPRGPPPPLPPHQNSIPPPSVPPHQSSYALKQQQSHDGSYPVKHYRNGGGSGRAGGGGGSSTASSHAQAVHDRRRSNESLSPSPDFLNCIDQSSSGPHAFTSSTPASHRGGGGGGHGGGSSGLRSSGGGGGRPAVPVPPPRKRSSNENVPFKLRRCRALYDCEADREDELDFKEGDIILILNETTDDEEWMEGCLETDTDRRGLFPASFVAVLSD